MKFKSIAESTAREDYINYVKEDFMTHKEFGERARQRLRVDHTETKLFGWIKESKLQKLIDDGIVKIYGGDYVFTTMRIPEVRKVGKSGKKVETGRVVSVLTSKAQQYFKEREDEANRAFRQDYAKEKDFEAFSEEFDGVIKGMN